MKRRLVKNKLRIFIRLLVAMSLCLLGTSCSTSAKPVSNDISSPIEVALDVIDLAPINQPTTVRLTVVTSMPPQEEWRTELNYTIPSNIKVDNAQLPRIIALEANVPQTFDFQITPTTLGEHLIIVNAQHIASTGGMMGDTAGFYLEVSEQQTYVRLSSLTPTPVIEDSNLQMRTIDQMPIIEGDQPVEQTPTPEK